MPLYIIQALSIIVRSIRDYKPLAFFGIIGGTIFSFGVIIEAVLFVRWLLTSRVSPFTTLVTVGVVALIVGFLLLILALIADMLDRQRRIEEDLLYYKKKEMLR